MQKQLKTAAKSAAPTPAPKASVTLADRAKKARAILKSISTPSLKMLRNAVLRSSIKKFERPGGWIDGNLKSWSDEHGYETFCAIGAVIDAEGPKTAKQAAIDAVFDSIPQKYRTEYGDSVRYGYSRANAVVDFNDSQSSKARVINAFKRALRQPLRKD